MANLHYKIKERIGCAWHVLLCMSNRVSTHHQVNKCLNLFRNVPTTISNKNTDPIT